MARCRVYGPPKMAKNIVDPWHLLMLHQMISGNQFEGALMQGAPQIGFENTLLGVRYRVVKDLPNGIVSCATRNAFICKAV
jgi:hypothetical protein